MVLLAGLLPLAGGILGLFYFLPRARGDQPGRADFFLARASYWAIIAGLICTSFLAMCGTLVCSLSILESLHILR